MADDTHDGDPAPEEQDRPLQPEDLPGIRMVIAGAVLAVLAPLFGFLGGSMVGAEGGGDTVQPLFLWMLGGIVVGSVGAIIAILGGLRLVRARHQRRSRTLRTTRSG